jgi:peptidoglycan/xylan/chitin deacetylase (PgdA/CDA1 family)
VILPGRIAPPFFFRFFSPDHLVFRLPGTEKVLYLTFDDGPVPEVTPAVLEILSARKIPATFFCLGSQALKYPEILAQVKEADHAIGNHTFHHLNGWKTPPAAYVEDVTRCESLFRTRLFRPPYGKFTPSQYLLLRKRYLFVLWSVLTYDFHRRVSKEQCLELAVRYTQPGSIIVFHDSIKAQKNLLYALPGFLDAMLEKGYIFRSLGGVEG